MVRERVSIYCCEGRGGTDWHTSSCGGEGGSLEADPLAQMGLNSRPGALDSTLVPSGPGAQRCGEDLETSPRRGLRCLTSVVHVKKISLLQKNVARPAIWEKM